MKKMKKMKTREKILMVSLDLFSEKGYDSVGVDLIASSVGIKGPSLYNHFKGKEDILDSIITMVEDRYDEHINEFINDRRCPESLEALKRTCMDTVKFAVTDEQTQKVRRLCVMEQFRKPEIATLTTKHQIDGLVRSYSGIIHNLMENKLFKTDDPEELAFELIAPISLLIGVADRQPKMVETVLQRMEKHIDRFIQIYQL